MRVFCLEKDQGEKYLTFKDCRLVQSESILSREGPREKYLIFKDCMLVQKESILSREGPWEKYLTLSLIHI